MKSVFLGFLCVGLIGCVAIPQTDDEITLTKVYNETSRYAIMEADGGTVSTLCETKSEVPVDAYQACTYKVDNGDTVVLLPYGKTIEMYQHYISSR
jgi:hypothetical protein